MFTFIKHPIISFRVWKRFLEEITPEEKAELRSKIVTDAKKDEIAMQVAKRAYPNLVW